MERPWSAGGALALRGGPGEPAATRCVRGVSAGVGDPGSRLEPPLCRGVTAGVGQKQYARSSMVTGMGHTSARD